MVIVLFVICAEPRSRTAKEEYICPEEVKGCIFTRKKRISAHQF